MHFLLRRYNDLSGQLPSPTALPRGKENRVHTENDAVVGHRRSGCSDEEIVPTLS
jgi:hypothetical protein